jgi:outer membrane protein OmpA-like peptidoglycan-associated protein
MPNFVIGECKTNFDAVEFSLAAGGTNNITREGTRTFIRYDFKGEGGQTKPSVLQILRNYEAAVKKIGGTTVIVKADEIFATFKIMKNGKEAVWIKINTGGDDSNDFYELNILQLEEMKQEVTSNDILNALNTDGHIALYINFENGKFNIKPESQKIIEQIADMLKTNIALKVSIEGHTDNVGTAAANKILSENRAKAVMNDLIAKGIDKTRLSAKGWGQDKPLLDNTTEDGKAKNRRVEIVKL